MSYSITKKLTGAILTETMIPIALNDLVVSHDVTLWP